MGVFNGYAKQIKNYFLTHYIKYKYEKRIGGKTNSHLTGIEKIFFTRSRIIFLNDSEKKLTLFGRVISRKPLGERVSRINLNNSIWN